MVIEIYVSCACTQAAEIKKGVAGATHSSVGLYLNNAAVASRALNKHAEALALFEEVLSIRKTNLGESHADVATTLSNIAALQKILKK